jgi:hypothetical protein
MQGSNFARYVGPITSTDDVIVDRRMFEPQSVDDRAIHWSANWSRQRMRYAVSAALRGVAGGVRPGHRRKQVRALIAEIPEENWATVEDYPDTGQTQIAETRLGDRRLIVRRTRVVLVRWRCCWATTKCSSLRARAHLLPSSAC